MGMGSERLDFTVGVVGAGSMGAAVASGLVRSGAMDALQVSVSNPSEGKLRPLAEMGISTFRSNADMLEGDVQVVVLAVKPQILPSVVGEMGEALKGRLVISIAAGIPLNTLEGLMPSSRVVRAMPNLPVQALSGATAVCVGSSATEEDAGHALGVFSCLGVAKLMREDQLDAEGAVVSCGPAYVALVADALTRRGVEAGLPAADCRQMVLSTMRGVAEQLLESGENPRAYMERVTSPGGTTAAGLRAMEPGLVDSLWVGVDAALRRTAELSGK